MIAVELYRRKGAPLSVMGGEVFEYERATKAEAVIEAARKLVKSDNAQWAIGSMKVMHDLEAALSALDKE
jgi:hypothetical protein